MSERIAAVNDFVATGYEVHLNFSPIILYEGWLEDYADALLEEVDDVLSEEAIKAQLKCEVIFLTHNEGLHEVNLGWHPKAEDLLWTPANQEGKCRRWVGGMCGIGGVLSAGAGVLRHFRLRVRAVL